MCSENFLSGIGNSRRDGGAANPVRTEHGDITAAASAIFASANANSWPIGEHHAYGMGSISRWRKGDKRGTFLGEMPGAAAEYAMGPIKKKLFGATPPAAQLHLRLQHVLRHLLGRSHHLLLRPSKLPLRPIRRMPHPTLIVGLLGGARG